MFEYLIRLVGHSGIAGNFAPWRWLFCDLLLVPILLVNLDWPQMKGMCAANYRTLALLTGFIFLV